MSTLYAQEPSKGNANCSDAGKTLASQVVPAYTDVDQENIWRQIVLGVDILSEGTGEGHESWHHMRLIKAHAV
jgi:hypothetical protein